ncbi:MAG TPA: hypothetical protein VFI22_18895, partial [Thermomicrobiales bacterium]|nr:hypothetical protein [Thermomicrobiales bacterium]
MARAAERQQRPGAGEPPRGLGDEAARQAALGAERREPSKREVDLYVRTYGTLLQTSGAIGVSSLEEAHINAAASLHAGARETAPDLNAFIYSIQRLPACIVDVKDILLGQTRQQFHHAGFHHLDSWDMVSAPGRRRRWLYDRRSTLAAYIASASDLDDLVPTIVAYQIEWNKIYRIILADRKLAKAIDAIAGGAAPTEEEIADVGERLLLSPADWLRLRSVWGGRVWPNLAKIAAGKKRYTLRMLGGSYLGYARSTRQWWAPASRLMHDLGLHDRPVYFVSSNTHSIVNVLSGTARRRKEAITEFIRA